MLALIYFLWRNSPSGPGSRHRRCFMFTLRNTTLSRTPLDEWSARCWEFHLTTHNTHNRQTSTPPALNPYTYWKVVVLRFVKVGKTVSTVVHLESGCDARQAYHYGYSWDDRIYWHRLIRDDKNKSKKIPELSEIFKWEFFFFFCDITLRLRMFVVQRFETVWWPYIQGSMDHCFVGPLTLEERISQSAPFRKLENSQIFRCVGVTSESNRGNLKVSV
jgi:hypothetical protein